MPSSSFGASLATPKLNVAIDTGNPFLNVTVDGFLKIGTVAATKSLAEDAYYVIKGGAQSDSLVFSFKFTISHTECAGTVAGMYVGMEYGMERIRGTHDWL
ncbi:hypothetical protein D5086_002167 [Populus alba]|uniref:Uncharacterized protein n=1 Tax=Populus alba TaxID=43335 RepID=A0ACC4D0R9_POPAL